MCNFHQAVAVKAATDESGSIDAGYKTIIRVALSRYWAERYVDGAEDVNGYNPYPLATQRQQEAFARSGLKRPLDGVEREELDAISFLRGKMAELALEQDISAKALKLPPVTAREPFIDMAIAHFYKGDPRGEFNLVDDVEREDLKPLHRAVSKLHADPKTREVLESLVKGKICTLYSEAPSQVNLALVEAYQNLPQKVKDVSARISKYSGNILLGGFSGLVGHSLHYGSVIGAGFAAGTASSANLALSGVFLAASFGGWNAFFGGKYQSVKDRVSAFAMQAGLTAVIAFGAQNILEHDHMSSEKAQWYAALPHELRENFRQGSLQNYERLSDELQDKVFEKAQAEGIPPEIYLLTCSGEDPVSNEVNLYLAQLNGQTLASAPPMQQSLELR